jgi:hypothetical protein
MLCRTAYSSANSTIPATTSLPSVPSKACISWCPKECVRKNRSACQTYPVGMRTFSSLLKFRSRLASAREINRRTASS